MSRSIPSRARGFAGSADAFSAFYRVHAQDLLTFFVRRTCDVDVAFDLTAETFAQAFAGRRPFRGESPGEAEAWLYVIASRQLAGYMRRGYVRRRLIERLEVDVPRPDESEIERVLELAEMSEFQAVIRTELARLSTEQRDALRLRVVDEASYATVAARLGISERAARMRVSRALNALSRAFEARNITRGDVS
jgi:RNA polymerase sigma factor (sigma-70 family)